MNTWNASDVYTIRDVVKEAVKSLSKNKDDIESVGVIANGLAKYCYLLGHDTGYANGHNDAKHGIDERKYPAQIQLNHNWRLNNELGCTGRN